MDTFLAIPTSSSVSMSPIYMDYNVPIINTTNFVSPVSVVEIDPLFPSVSVDNRLFPTVTTMLNPNSSTYYYYDSGIGLSPLAKHQTNEYLRYKFLDNALVKDYKHILTMLRVDNGSVSVVKGDKGEVGSSKDVEKKVDFISNEILTRSKNMKILEKIVQKNPHIKFYDLSHNPDLVFSTQSKYVKNKLKEMS